MVFLEILINYIIPIIYDSFVTLILVLLFLFIFRIKDSNIRILFFFFPLIKPIIVIAEKINVNEIALGSRDFTGGIRFPDPLKFFPPYSKIEIFDMVNFSELNNFILVIALISISIILIARWTNIALLYRSLAYEEKVSSKEVPELYSIIDNYVERIKVKAPDISLTHRKYYTPFIVGIKTCTLVLSPTLIEKLNNEEKETLINHELSHIKRRDNLIGWIALILRDLNFFNPFAYITYYLIKSEQESACDKLMTKYSEKSPKQIAKNFLNSILKLKSVQEDYVLKEKHSINYGSPYLFKRGINFNIIHNRVRNILKVNPNKIHAKIFPKTSMYLLFLFLLFIQITIVLKFCNTLIVLR